MSYLNSYDASTFGYPKTDGVLRVVGGHVPFGLINTRVNPLEKNRAGFRNAFRATFHNGFCKNSLKKSFKGNLPCGEKIFTNFLFWSIIFVFLLREAPSWYLHHSKTYIQGIQNNVWHHHIYVNYTKHYELSNKRKRIFWKFY